MNGQNTLYAKTSHAIITGKTQAHSQELTKANKRREVIYCAAGEGMIDIYGSASLPRKNFSICASEGTVYRLSIKAVGFFAVKIIKALTKRLFSL